MKRNVAIVLGMVTWAATGCLELNTKNSSSGDGGNGGTAGHGGSGGTTAGGGGTIEAFCGNGLIEANEECDDGNPNNDDGCDSNCIRERSSALFIGKPGMTGFMDGVGSDALLTANSILAIWGDTLYLGDNSTVRTANVITAEVKTIAGAAGTAGFADAAYGFDARFNNVNAFATDGTTVWVADSGNHLLRGISINAPYTTTTVAGAAGMAGTVDGPGPQARFDTIRGLTYLNGILYIVDATAVVLRSYNPVTNEVKTLAGVAYAVGNQDGIGSTARFSSPRYLTSDGSNRIFIAETQGSIIRQYNVNTGEVKTLAGTGLCGHVDGPAPAARINTPRGIAYDGQRIYWTENEAHLIRQQTLVTGEVTTLSGLLPPCAIDCTCGTAMGGGYVEGLLSSAQWKGPYDIVYHPPSKTFYVSDGGNYVVRRIR
ncbi:MAG TPA: hypothetical protein PK156_06600 [Polyangium sp.]|nr:hypothetical protein [Polyangium sp.]